MEKEYNQWIKLGDFNPLTRVTFLFICLLFVVFFVSSHIKNDYDMSKKINKLQEQNNHMLNYISILEDATFLHMKEIYQLKKSCN